VPRLHRVRLPPPGRGDRPPSESPPGTARSTWNTCHDARGCGEGETLGSRARTAPRRVSRCKAPLPGQGAFHLERVPRRARKRKKGGHATGASTQRPSAGPRAGHSCNDSALSTGANASTDEGTLRLRQTTRAGKQRHRARVPVRGTPATTARSTWNNCHDERRGGRGRHAARAREQLPPRVSRCKAPLPGQGAFHLEWVPRRAATRKEGTARDSREQAAPPRAGPPCEAPLQRQRPFTRSRRFDGRRYPCHDSALHVERVPRRAVALGGGGMRIARASSANRARVPRARHPCHDRAFHVERVPRQAATREEGGTRRAQAGKRNRAWVRVQGTPATARFFHVEQVPRGRGRPGRRGTRHAEKNTATARGSRCGQSQ
jgi:hypothetical protein